jgi:hypothetical protein
LSGPVQSAPASPTAAKPSRFQKWHRRVVGFCLAIFAFEIGLFLVVFPWRETWDLSWMAVHSRRFSDLWMSRYFRGAISGLGLLNIYIAFAELLRQVKSMFEQ